MIKHSLAVSSGTLVANGRRKRKGKHHNPRHRKTLASKGGKSRKRNPASFAAMTKRKSSHKRRRNPGEVGGVSLANLAVGSVVAIAAGAMTNAFYKNYAPASMTSAIPATIAPAIGPGLVCALAFYAHKKMKPGMGKDVAKYVAITSGFAAVNGVAGAQIEKTVQSFLPGGAAAPTGGASGGSSSETKGYLNRRGKYVNGAWLPTSAGTNGGWVQPRGALPAPRALAGAGGAGIHSGAKRSLFGV